MTVTDDTHAEPATHCPQAWAEVIRRSDSDGPLVAIRCPHYFDPIRLFPLRTPGTGER